MKKFTLFLLTAAFFCSAIWSQSASYSAANRKTAERCLKLAENCVLSSSWEGALSQAELGLSYDETISDLYYIKANALYNLKYKRAFVLQTIKQAFDTDNWINYNKNSARILYADLLSDTKVYDKALEVLNSSPYIYSADAEFIRIKTLYRMGTKDSVKLARDKLLNAKKIYPNDQRFPRLFFIFETMFMTYAERNGTSYEIPQEVVHMAETYIVKFPDYSTKDIEMEVMSSMFNSGERQKRLLKAVGEKNQHNPLFAIAALKAGVISEEKAFNLFFNDSNDGIYLVQLEAFASLITDENLLKTLYNHLNAFEGTLIIDDDLDLCNEIIVKYERGRAKTIYYDSNNDEILEMYCECDYGAPYKIAYENTGTELYYDIYPAVCKVNVREQNTIYTFIDDDFAYTPFEMLTDAVFKNHGVDFYIPFVSEEAGEPEAFVLVKNTNRIEIPVEERPGAKAKYTVNKGIPVSIYFYDGDEEYAYANLEGGYPFTRYADYDNDGVMETSELYDYDEEGVFDSPEDIELIQKIFGKISLTEKLYLKRIEIDRDNDTIIDFKTDYTGKGGQVTSWDTDGNGLWDIENIVYPKDAENRLVEEVIIYNSNGTSKIMITNVDEVPVKLTYNKKELPVVKGRNRNYYWIEKAATVEEENGIYATIGDNVSLSEVQVVQIKNHRFSVIKVGNSIFCKQLPDTGYNFDFKEFVNE